MLPNLFPDTDYNLMPLEQLREAISWNPYHFWGVAGLKIKVMSSCNTVLRQYAWQGSDVGGRNDIAQAIQRAEQRIIPILGYAPAPRYMQVRLPYPQHPDEQVRRIGEVGGNGRWAGIKLPEGMIQAVGVQKIEEIGEADVTLSDVNLDTVLDTFTVSIPTAVTDASQIAVYHISTERMGEGLSERFRISPIAVSISNGVATITGRSYMIIRPVLYEDARADTESYLDVTVTGNYASKLLVCKKYIDPNGTTYSDSQAVIIWQSEPHDMYDGLISRDPAGEAYSIARVGIQNAQTGIVFPVESMWDTVNNQWIAVQPYNVNTSPSHVIIRYQAGAPLVNGRVQTKFADAFSKAAMAEMPNRICACDAANKVLHRWQFDLAQSGGAANESYSQVSAGDLANPLGTKRGYVEAWKFVKMHRILSGKIF